MDTLTQEAMQAVLKAWDDIHTTLPPQMLKALRDLATQYEKEMSYDKNDTAEFDEEFQEWCEGEGGMLFDAPGDIEETCAEFFRLGRYNRKPLVVLRYIDDDGSEDDVVPDGVELYTVDETSLDGGICPFCNADVEDVELGKCEECGFEFGQGGGEELIKWIKEQEAKESE